MRKQHDATLNSKMTRQEMNIFLPLIIVAGLGGCVKVAPFLLQLF